MPSFSQEEIGVFNDLSAMSEKDRTDVLNASPVETADKYLQYLHSQETGKGILPENVRQEQHPAIPDKQRLILENLATSPEAKLKTLEKWHPELEFGMQPNFKKDPNQIYARWSGSQDPWSVLQPNNKPQFMGGQGFQGFGELGQDIADTAIPALGALGQGAASAYGGAQGALGGGLATGGNPVAMFAGAKLGAGVAGGAAGAAFKKAQGAAGTMLGIEDNNPDVKNEFLAGLTSPWLFGTGAKGPAQKGLITTALNAGTAGAGAFISGEKATDVRRAVALQPQIQELAKGGEGAVRSKVEEAVDRLRGSLFEQKNLIGQNIEQVTSVADKPVDIRPAVAKLQAVIDDLARKQSGHFTEADKEIIDRFKAQINKHLAPLETSAEQGPTGLATGETTQAYGKIPETMSARDAWVFKQRLSDLGGAARGEGRYEALSSDQKKFVSAISKAREEIDKSLITATADVPNIRGTKGVGDLFSRYNELSDIGDTLKDLRGAGARPETPFNALQKLTANSSKAGYQREALKGLDPDLARLIQEQADVLRLGYKFNPAVNEALGGSGVATTSKSGVAKAIGAGIGLTLGWLASDAHPEGAALGGAAAGRMLVNRAGSPRSLGMMMRLGQGPRAAADFVQEPFGQNFYLPQIYGNKMGAPYVLSPWLRQEEK